MISISAVSAVSAVIGSIEALVQSARVKKGSPVCSELIKSVQDIIYKQYFLSFFCFYFNTVNPNHAFVSDSLLP